MRFSTAPPMYCTQTTHVYVLYKPGSPLLSVVEVERERNTQRNTNPSVSFWFTSRPQWQQYGVGATPMSWLHKIFTQYSVLLFNFFFFFLYTYIHSCSVVRSFKHKYTYLSQNKDVVVLKLYSLSSAELEYIHNMVVGTRGWGWMGGGVGSGVE